MKYSKEIADKLLELLATGEQSIQAICEVLKIDRKTFYNWKKKKSFADKLQQAHQQRLDAIGEMAISGLALLLSKHEYDETTTEFMEGKDGKPKIKSRKVVKKFIMPNPGMVALALTNRQSDDWKNKTEINHSGSIKMGKDLADETYD